MDQAISSILSEKYKNFELLIYDDLSSDESPQIIQKYANEDGRIKFFKGDKKTSNVGSIYKFLVEKSEGKYFIASDSDDICLPERLELLVDLANRNPSASLFFGKTRLVNGDCSQTLGFYGKVGTPYELFMNNFAPDGASLISKEHYLQCGGYDDSIEWAEDYDLRLRLLETGPFIYIDKEVYLYRQHQSSWTAKKRSIKKEFDFKDKIYKRNTAFTKYLLTKDKKINYRSYVGIKYSAAYFVIHKNYFKAYKLLDSLWGRKNNKLNCFKIWLYCHIGSSRKIKKNLLDMDKKTERSNLINRSVVTGEMLKSGLLKMGVQKGGKIIVHSSLSCFGYVLGGPKTIISVLKEIIGEQGLIIMPAFTYYTEVPSQECFSLESPCSKDMGVIPEAFRKSENTFRNFHPFTSFTFWGKEAKKLSEKYNFSDSFALNSPLGELLALEGDVLMLGTDFSVVSILHTAEYISNVFYSSYKSIFNYIDKGSKKTIELRRTGHSGEFNKIKDYIKDRDLKCVDIGTAKCFFISASVLINIAKDLLMKAPDFFLCRDEKCVTCSERRKLAL